VDGNDVDITSRIVTTGTPHHSYATTGAMCLAAATRLDGTIPAEFARETDGLDVTIGHPKGTITIGVETATRAGDTTVERVRVGRTARLLVDGRLFYRHVPGWRVLGSHPVGTHLATESRVLVEDAA